MLELGLAAEPEPCHRAGSERAVPAIPGSLLDWQRYPIAVALELAALRFLIAAARKLADWRCRTARAQDSCRYWAFGLE